MSLEAKLIAIINAIGADIKAVILKQGDLTALNTTDKNNLVAAINEIVAAMPSQGAQINDSAGNGATTVTWSADKIFAAIEAAKTAVKDSLVNGAGAALDTLSELATALGNDPNFATTIATGLANRVRFDAQQTLTSPQKTQARDNIGAASASDLSTLTAAIGDTERDFVAIYNAAKA